MAKKVWKDELLEDRNIEIVQNMLANGFSKEQISLITGLNIKEIERLRNI